MIRSLFLLAMLVLAACRPAAEAPAPDAQAALVRVRERLSLATRETPIERTVQLAVEGDAVRPQWTQPGEARTADLSLPREAHRPFQLADVQSGLRIEAALHGAVGVPAEIASSGVVYRGAFAGGDLVHLPTPRGTEDYLWLPQPLAGSEIAYDVALGDTVAGLRLVENVLEFLDEHGTPRLRVPPPFVVDTAGVRREARLAVEGCAVDRSPVAPWDRPTTDPGATNCRVVVRWDGAGLRGPLLVDPGWTTTLFPTYGHADGVLAPLGTGRALIAAGIYGGSYTATAELFDQNTLRWATTGSLSTGRRAAAATVLTDGRVLVTGGQGNAGTSVRAADAYTAATGAWTTTQMVGARQSHTSTLLSDGRVLVAGGTNYSGSVGTFLRDAEIFDPSSDGWSSTPQLNVARAYHAAVRLTDGKVLVAGGSPATPSAEVWNGSAWTSVGSMSTGRSQPSMALLQNGTVLVMSGETSAAELYDPASATFGPGTALPSARANCALYTLSSGVLAVGGNVSGNYLTSVLLYQASPGWSSLPSTTYPHSALKLAPLGGRWLLAAAGSDGNPPEIFDTGSCLSAGQCPSGFCVDGECCNSACTGSCDRCDVAGHEGTCNPVPAVTQGTPSCAPYFCDGTSSSCPTTCSSANPCTSGYVCSNGSCIPLKAIGTTCQSGGECQSAFCADGVCCNTSCAGTCDRCNLSGSVGACTNFTGPEPSCGAYQCNGASASCPMSCTTSAQCASGYYCGGGRCLLPKGNGSSCQAGSECQSGFCADGLCCNSACTGGCDRCDLSGSAGVCTVVAGNSGTCTAYLCDGTHASCPTSCTADTDCQSAYFCGAGVCQPRHTQGATCSRAAECVNGTCADGYCCNAACTGSCERCDLTGKQGTCSPVSAGLPGHGSCAPYLCDGARASCPAACNASTQCASGNVCLGGVCAPPLADGARCQADGDCLHGHCASGVCCASACTGGCGRCDLTPGTCLPAMKGSTGSPVSCGLYLCDGASTSCPAGCSLDADCQAGSYCDTQGRCQPRRTTGATCQSAKECQSGVCADGVCCGSACTGECERCNLPAKEGTCSPVPDAAPARTTCAPYLCDGTNRACPAACAADADCTSGLVCLSSRCVPRRDLGQTCQSAHDCQSGFCADGYCCESACDGACDACNVLGALGRCSLRPAGQAGQPSCGLALCNGQSARCPTGCTQNSDCTSDAFCSAQGSCTARLPLGSACDGSSQCASGFCVDGVCCGSACAGQCVSCALPAQRGTCLPVAGAPVGGRPACASDGSQCGGRCDGVHPDACSFPAAAVTCRAASCTNAVATAPAQCAGDGTCPASTAVSCAPYQCGASACLTRCAADGDCTDGFYCQAGRCTQRLAPGARCQAAHECEGGFCSDGVCCNQACGGSCDRCDLPGKQGLCTLAPDLPAAADSVCAPFLCTGESASCPERCHADADCLGGLRCTPEGACVEPLPDGARCSSDAACFGGHCVDGVCCESACDGQCQTCAAPGQEGRCTLVTGAPVGGRPACGGEGPCAGSCSGGAASCSYPAAATSCGPAFCSDGVQVDLSTCDGAGRCTAGALTDCPSGACAGARCAPKAPPTTPVEIPGGNCTQAPADGLAALLLALLARRRLRR